MDTHTHIHTHTQTHAHTHNILSCKHIITALTHTSEVIFFHSCLHDMYSCTALGTNSSTIHNLLLEWHKAAGNVENEAFAEGAGVGYAVEVTAPRAEVWVRGV